MKLIKTQSDCNRWGRMAAVTFIVLVWGSGMTRAQGPAPEPPAEPAPLPVQTPPVMDVSERQLEQTAEAYLDISEIQSRLQAELADVEDQADIQRRVEAAQPRIIEAVEATGLTVQEYEGVMRAVNQDKDLRNTLIALVDARQDAAEPAVQQAEPSDIPASDIDKAAAVYQAVQKLNQELQQDLAGVEDQVAIQKRVAEAEVAMHRIVTQEGLDIERYGMIIHAVQQDPALLEQFMRQIE